MLRIEIMNFILGYNSGAYAELAPVRQAQKYPPGQVKDAPLPERGIGRYLTPPETRRPGLMCLLPRSPGSFCHSASGRGWYQPESPTNQLGVAE